MWRLIVCALLVRALPAGIIGLAIPQPDRYGLPGELLVFQGVITNGTPAPLAASEMWVNFSGVDYRIDVVDLLPTHSFVLDPGQSTGSIDLFAAQFNFLINNDPIDPDLPYPFDVQLQNINDDLSLPLTVSITDGDAPVAPVPEPGSLLLVAASAACVGLRKNRKAALGLAMMLLVGLREPAAAQSQTVLFQTGPPGIFWYGQELMIAIPILNGGTGTANAAALISATLGGVRSIRPNGYTGIGTLGSGQQAVAQLAFPSNPFNEGQRLRLVIDGVYGFSVEYKFQVSRVVDLPFVRANNSAVGSGVPLPADEPYNPVRPVYPPAGPTNPTVRFNPLPVNPAAGPPQVLGPAANGATLAPDPPAAAVFPIAIATNKPRQERTAGEQVRMLSNSSVDAASNFSHPQDPSGDVAIFTRPDGIRRRVVMTTGNIWAAFAEVAENGLPVRAADFRAISLDRALNPGGATLDGGFWGDQVVRYIPSRGMWVWIMQTRPLTAADGRRQPNRLRIAWTSTARLLSSSGERWTRLDIQPQRLGESGTNQWFDYPSIGFTSGHLHVGINLLNSTLAPTPENPAVLKEQSVNQGRKFFRIPLGEISDTAGSMTYRYTLAPQPANFSAHTGNNEDRIYWAAHQANDILRIWEWRDDRNDPSTSDVTISPFNAKNYSSMDPGGFDWMQRHLSWAVLGATRETFTNLDNTVDRTVTFAWGAGKDDNGGHPQPYVRIATFRVETLIFGTITTYTRVNEKDWWHSGDAFHFPALSTTGFHRGIVAARGGPGLYARPDFGYTFSNNLYGMANSTATDRTAESPRFGDYFTIVPDPAGSSCFSVFGNVVTTNASANPGGCALTGGAGCNLIPRYAVFCTPESPTPR